MLTYTVWFKAIEQKTWHKLENIKNDYIDLAVRCRVFISEDEVRYEVPLTCVFKFSKERRFALSGEEKAKYDPKSN